jgi:exosortase
MSTLPAAETSHEEPRERAKPGIAGILTVALLGGLLLGLYWKILSALLTQWWDDPNYSHGFLVPLFSLYLIWGRRALLARLPRTGSLAGIGVVVGGLALLYLGNLGADNFLMRSSLIVVLGGLILFHLGPAISRAILFPLAFLFFMVPLPGVIFYAITFPLQQLAAQQAAWSLETLGVPVLLDGNIIHLAQLSLGVTEACSGIRSLISLAAGAVAWAYLFIPRGLAMILFVAATLPITIVANAARVVLTGLIGQYIGVEYASGFFHEFAGLGIYVAAFACLLATHSLLSLGGRLLGRVRS